MGSLGHLSKHTKYETGWDWDPFAENAAMLATEQAFPLVTQYKETVRD